MLWHVAVRFPPSRKAALTLVALQQGLDSLAHTGSPTSPCQQRWAHKDLLSPGPSAALPWSLQDFGSRGAAAGCRGVVQGLFLAAASPQALTPCCGLGCAEGATVRSCPYRQVLEFRIISS